jgi:hypothetical protein
MGIRPSLRGRLDVLRYGGRGANQSASPIQDEIPAQEVPDLRRRAVLGCWRVGIDHGDDERAFAHGRVSYDVEGGRARGVWMC